MSMTDTTNEFAFDQELRQAAVKVFSVSGGITELLTLRSRMLQEMSKAVFAVYIARHGGPPSPAEIQRLRRLVLSIWDDMVNTARMSDVQKEM
jgi:hypothetical protein